MRLIVLAVAAALAVAGGGLIGGALLAEPVPASASSGTTLPWDLIDCTFAIGFARIPQDLIAERLPPGFRPAGPIGGSSLVTSLLPQPATVGFEINTCREGAGVDGPVEDMTYASIWTAVTPPSEKRVSGVRSYFVNWDPLIPDAERRALFDAAGVPAHDGAITMQGPAPGDAGGVLDAAYTVDGVGDFAMTAVLADDPDTGVGGNFGQWTEAADGDLAYWFTDWRTETRLQGPGTVSVPADSWIAATWGTPAIPAAFWYGTWDYTGGHVTLPS